MSLKKQPIRILFLIDLLSIGGTENQLIWLVENLPRDRFYPVIGILRHNAYSKSLNLRTPIVAFDGPNIPIFRNLNRVRLIRQFIMKEAIDVVQTHFPNAELYGVIASKTSKQKPIIIITRRNLFHWLHERRGKHLFYFNKLTARMADSVLVNSYKVSHLCQKLECIDSSRIKVIQNSVEISHFSTIDSGSCRSRFNFSEQEIIIGVVGNWRPVKGLKIFLDAAALIQKERNNTHFVLVGNGTQEKELKEQCNKLGIKDNVTFLGNNTQVPAIMATFDIAVQPSFSESFSNVLLEYMASGRSIVATRVGDADQMIEDGENGLLVPSGDVGRLAGAVVELINSHEKRARFGQNALRKVKDKWDGKVILQQYIDFYLDLLLSVARR